MKDIPSSQGFSWQQVLGAVLLMIAALTLGYAMLLLCTFFEACLIRKNDSGRIYGITFIDDTEGIALNGSRLGKGYAANRFEAYFADSTQNLFLDERLYGKLPNMKQGDTVLAHILTICSSPL